MSKQTIKSNPRVVVYPDLERHAEDARQGLTSSDVGELLESMRETIRGDLNCAGTITIEHNSKEVCSHCGAVWFECFGLYPFPAGVRQSCCKEAIDEWSKKASD